MGTFMGRRSVAEVELRRALGASLAAYREGVPLKQGDLGRLTHYSRTSIAHIEAGRQFPGREFWSTADRRLDARGALLAHYDRVCRQEKQWKIAELRGASRDGGEPPGTPPRDDDWRRDDVNRRELIRLMTLTGTLLAIPASALDAERVAHAAAHPRRLDPVVLTEYERLNAALWRTYSGTRTKRDVLPLARRQVALLKKCLDEPQRAEDRRRLCRLAGDVFQLCGEIFFDGGGYADAAHCYSIAAHASKEAREYDLWACAMTRHAFISIYEREHRSAVPLLDGAARLAERGDPGRATRYWVAAVRAQASAGLGELAACRRALDEAEEVVHLPAPEHTGWLRFESSRLDGERASCFVALGRPDLAEGPLHALLRADISTRRRGGVLTDLAVVGAQRRDVDQLLLHGAAALDTVRQTASAGYVGRKLDDLRGRLVPFLGNRHVRFLDEQIRAVTAAAPEQ
ncbi:helix-turn-helix domain-containing protein [Saccharopolyspora sp. CA-218241]|uniref:helix-turn-helix domain-containing protein n=1 Tax=Saccharopolyspora sp. CA-218241 TaxID=3240027 RepID=UPI003D96F161